MLVAKLAKMGNFCLVKSDVMVVLYVSYTHSLFWLPLAEMFLFLFNRLHRYMSWWHGKLMGD